MRSLVSYTCWQGSYGQYLSGKALRFSSLDKTGQPCGKRLVMKFARTRRACDWHAFQLFLRVLSKLHGVVSTTRYLVR